MAFEAKTPTGRNSEGFLVSSPRTANLFDNIGILALIAFSKSEALTLSCVWFLFSANLKGLISELPTHN